MENDTSALCANLCNEIVALENDLIPLLYLIPESYFLTKISMSFEMCTVHFDALKNRVIKIHLYFSRVAKILNNKQGMIT